MVLCIYKVLSMHFYRDGIIIYLFLIIPVIHETLFLMITQKKYFMYISPLRVYSYRTNIITFQKYVPQVFFKNNLLCQTKS